MKDALPEIEAAMPGYYEGLMKLGSVLDLDPSMMAKELRVSKEIIDGLRQKHAGEIARLRSSRKIADSLFADLAFVRLTKLQDKLLSDIEANMDELPIGKRVELFQFLAGYLAKQDENRRSREGVKPAGHEGRLGKGELEVRAMRLLEGGNSK